MARSTTRLASPDRTLQSGFSLIELLVTVAVLGVCSAVASLSLAHTLDHAQGRASAQAWQTAAARAQLRQLALGEAVGLTASHEAQWLHGPHGAECQIDAAGAAVATNVSRWRRGTEVAVTFGGLSAAPDSAGSVFFGQGVLATRVVVRVESG